MRASSWLPKPQNAPSNRIEFERYLIDTGLLHHHASGIYVALPLLKLMVRRVESSFSCVFETELDASQIELPAIQSHEFFTASGRMDLFGKEIFQLRDSKDRCYILSPTNEEMVADIVRRYFLPLSGPRVSIYQTEKKFRDEIGGGSISRTREFRMMELYTMHSDQADMRSWAGRIIDSVGRLYKNLGCKLEIIESKETATSRFSGYRSIEFRVRSRVRTGIVDAEGVPLLELAKWTPLGETYLKQDGLQLSCLGAGAIRVLLHLFERSLGEAKYSPGTVVRWPDGVFPIYSAIVLPDRRSRFVKNGLVLEDLYRDCHTAHTLLDDRTNLKFELRMKQIGQLGIQHLFLANLEGGVRHHDMGKGSSKDLSREAALRLIQDIQPNS